MKTDHPGDLYDQAFFASQLDGMLRSARHVTSFLFPMIKPRSVIDFGCGWGAWLKAFEELGVTDIWGIDGHYIDPTKLLINADRFQATDLTEPVLVDRSFDSALCLEVAEHLPKKRAAGLVADLVAAAPVVVFSAAIPHQGGVGHINEQWSSYWTSLFAQRDYKLVDALRPQLRHERQIEFFYRQNLVLYVKHESLGQFPALLSIVEQQGKTVEEWVYASVYQAQTGPLPMRRLIREIPSASLRVIRRCLHSFSRRGAVTSEPTQPERDGIVGE